MPPEVVHRGQAAADKGRPTVDSAAPVDTGRFLREARAHQSQEIDPGGSVSPTIITQLPEGYTVVEQSVGRATAQWLLHIRCECGHGWFECEALQNARCPACGKVIQLDIQPRD
jgi:hypothetical protein